MCSLFLRFWAPGKTEAPYCRHEAVSQSPPRVFWIQSQKENAMSVVLQLGHILNVLCVGTIWVELASLTVEASRSLQLVATVQKS